MRIIFISLIYNPQEIDTYLSKSTIGLEEASNTLQLRLIDGFLSQPDTSLTVLSSPPFGPFPGKYRQLFFKSREWEYKGTVVHELGYVNLPWIKMLIRERKLFSRLREILDAASDGETAVIAYSLYPSFLRIFKKLSRLYPDVHTSVVVTDLFGKYGVRPANPVKSILVDIYNAYLTVLQQYPDSFTLLTEQMRFPLQVGDRPFCVVEGIAADLPAGSAPRQDTDQKIILYAGTLRYEYGIRTLLDAFRLIQDPDYALWIFGSGDAADEITALSRKDPRIRFFGFLSKAELNKLQQQATVLVNPRQNDGEYVKYSFPSKTFEYLASGIPMVGYKLAGFPNDYDNCIFYVNGNTPEALRDKLVEVCSMPRSERDSFAAHARDYVLENKNSIRQTEKILNMIKGSLS